MADEAEKAHRVLFIKVRTPSPDATALLATMMKSALPLYQSFGDAKVRLLRNVDDQTQFLQVIHSLREQRTKSGSDVLFRMITSASPVEKSCVYDSAQIMNLLDGKF